jgi:hypothetical protein
MIFELFNHRRYRLRLVRLYIERDHWDYWIKLRGDWEIIDRDNGDEIATELKNFARFQAKRACRIWNRFAK